MNNFFRKCPCCNKDLQYTTKEKRDLCEKEKQICVICSIKKIDKNGKNNPFYGKHHIKKTIKKLKKINKAYTQTKDFGIKSEVELTIEDFFKLCESEGQYEIETPDGWKEIEFLVKKKNKECYKFSTELKLELKCSNEHQILTNHDWKKAQDIQIGNTILTKNGVDIIKSKEYLGIKNTFDLRIKSDQNRYYTNNIISHNCGKSRIAEALASEWKLNLIKFDPSKVFSSQVGASEGNMHLALARIEALSPCILFIDEIEKGFAGIQSSSLSDAGTTARTIGIFLIWMNDNNSYVFNIATCNQIHFLPPELIERFDEIFYVGLPTTNERKEILKIQIKENKRDPKKFNIDKLANACNYLSGRKIQQAVKEAMFTAFNLFEKDKKTDLNNEILEKSLKIKIPLIKTMEKQLEYLIRWVGYNKETNDGIRARFANENKDDIDELFDSILKKTNSNDKNISDLQCETEKPPLY